MTLWNYVAIMGQNAILSSEDTSKNGVFERKNITVHEMARTILMDSKLTDVFWVKELHTTIHI
jgi:hypothetical protein